jgi:hypothetical protein
MGDSNLNFIGFDEATEYLYDEFDFSVDATPRSTHGNNAAFENINRISDSSIQTATNKKLVPINQKASPGILAKPFQELQSPILDNYNPSRDYASNSNPKPNNDESKPLNQTNYNSNVTKNDQPKTDKRAGKDSSRRYNQTSYQTHDGRNRNYPGVQSKTHNNDIAINSASMVNDQARDPFDIAFKNQKYTKNSINNQKVNKKKHQMQRDRAQNYEKQIYDQYLKEKDSLKNDNNVGSGNNVSKKLSKRSDYVVKTNRNKLPYGLRSHFEEITSNTTGAYESIPKDHLLTADHASSRDVSNKRDRKSPKTKVVNNVKRIVPTSSDMLKNLIENDYKSHGSTH